MSPVRGIRGATTVDEDNPAQIVDATRELLTALIEANQIDEAEIAGAWFTTTPDLRSEFPAVAARQLGWVDVPLLCGHEMDVPYDNPTSIARCVRVMILLNTDRPRAAFQFLYLRGAQAIHEELQRARRGELPAPATVIRGPRPSGVPAP